MSWAEVFKINSDMAKPLNELILEHIGLAASDAVLKVLSTEIAVDWNEKIKVGKTFTAMVNGSARIKLDCTYSNIDGFDVYIISSDGVTVGKYSKSVTGEMSEILDVDFNISKNEKYSVYIYVKYGNIYTSFTCNSLKVCGSITDPTLITIESEV